MAQGKRALIRAWQRAVRDNRRLTSTAKLVLYTLATHSTANGECSPSIQQLARDCSLSSSSIKRHIRQGRELGFVVVTRRSHQRVQQTNHYQLIFPIRPKQNLNDDESPWLHFIEQAGSMN